MGPVARRVKGIDEGDMQRPHFLGCFRVLNLKSASRSCTVNYVSMRFCQGLFCSIYFGSMSNARKIVL
jgi:hypothetical protein